eukprot:scaffold259261_cov33-Tisochrysis_lutea.AAC.1
MWGRGDAIQSPRATGVRAALDYKTHRDIEIVHLLLLISILHTGTSSLIGVELLYFLSLERNRLPTREASFVTRERSGARERGREWGGGKGKGTAMDVKKLKVAELKELLSARGLSTNGKKDELVARLELSEKERAGAAGPAAADDDVPPAQEQPEAPGAPSPAEPSQAPGPPAHVAAS